jgi:hypothetical protein
MGEAKELSRHNYRQTAFYETGELIAINLALRLAQKLLSTTTTSVIMPPGGEFPNATIHVIPK